MSEVYKRSNSVTFGGSSLLTVMCWTTVNRVRGLMVTFLGHEI